MIEILLQPRERNHPAIGHLHWWGRRGRFWDMDFIENASKEQLDTLQAIIEEIIEELARVCEAPELPNLIEDIEICGSYAYGIQKLFSDFDIQLAAANVRNQRRVEEILSNNVNLITEMMYDCSMRIKHMIEIRFQCHDNKEYNEIYSLGERQLYGREHGVPMPDNYHRRYNPETRRYDVELREAPVRDSDYWTPEGEERRER